MVNTKQEPCTHHWLINDKNHGICRYCGKRKQFPKKLKSKHIGIAEHIRLKNEAYAMESELSSKHKCAQA